MFQSDLGKMAVECFSNLCSNAGKALQHHLSDRCSHTWMCPRQINQVLFRKCNHLKLVQRIFSPGLVALVADMTAHCCVVAQWEQWGNLPGCLDQRLVLLTLQDLHVHDDDLESYNEIFRKTKPPSDLSVPICFLSGCTPYRDLTFYKMPVWFNSPCADAWHGHRSPAPSGLAVLLWWLGFWYLCSSDQVSMNLESWFVKESK